MEISFSGVKKVKEKEKRGMEKEINGEIFIKFVNENFKIIDEFINETGLSRSHVYKLFYEKVRVGDKTIKKFTFATGVYNF